MAEMLWGPYFDNSLGLSPTIDGGFVVYGRTDSTGGDVQCDYHGGELDGWIVKADSEGGIEWQNCYGGSKRDAVVGVIPLADSSYLCGGITESNDGQVTGNHGSSDIWIFKIDFFGNLIWQKCFGGSGYDNFCSFKNILDGNFYIYGSTSSFDGDVHGNQSNNEVQSDGWLVKISPIGNLIWQKCFGGNASEGLSDMLEFPGGKLVILGGTNTSNHSGNVTCDLHGASDIWLISVTDTTKVGINDLPLSKRSVKVYPNPSSYFVTIEYSLSGMKFPANLSITDALGRIVKNFEVTAPSGEFIWKPEHSGIYIYHLSNGEIQSGKIMVDK